MTPPKTVSTLTISDIRHLFETSADANVVRDCVRAIGADVGGVFESEMKDYQRSKATDRLVVAHNAGRTPRVITKHRATPMLTRPMRKRCPECLQRNTVIDGKFENHMALPSPYGHASKMCVGSGHQVTQEQPSLQENMQRRSVPHKRRSKHM